MSIRQTTGRIGVLILLLVLATPTWATTELELQLPLHVFYSCANCHQEASSPTPSDPALNPFGLDFNDPAIGNNTWNSELAGLDSDGDGCNNGAEIGDVNGNGHPDNGVIRESSNPGVDGDCSSTSFFVEASWGELKAMFDNR